MAETADAGPLESRAALWLPLLQSLTERVEPWYVWKNPDSALSGRGDVDSAAPRGSWAEIEAAFHSWAAEQRLDHVMACRHIPRTLNLVAVTRRVPDLLQLEVKGTTTFRGSTLFRAEDLRQWTVIDPRGFRRLRSGAEGLFKFVMNGMRRGGRPDYEGLAGKRVLELIEEDAAGMREAATIFGAAEPWILTAVQAARNGSWDRGSLVRLETYSGLRSLTEPWTLAERIWFRAVRKPFCPLLQAIYGGRTAPPDLAAWLENVARTHPVQTLPDGAEAGS